LTEFEIFQTLDEKTENLYELIELKFDSDFLWNNRLDLKRSEAVLYSIQMFLHDYFVTKEEEVIYKNNILKNF